MRGAKVRLGFSFSDHPFSSGLTTTELTGADGEAEIQHANTGRAEIYVDGRKVGEFDSPGSATVTI